MAKGDNQDAGHRKVSPASAELVPLDSNVPAPPVDLKDHGVIQWNKIWSAGMRWMHSEEDYHWVHIIARAYDQISEFQTRIEKDGLIVKGYAGQDAAHPLIGEIRKCEMVIMKALSTLGFSPTDRARLGIKEIERQTKLNKLQQDTRGA